MKEAQSPLHMRSIDHLDGLVQPSGYYVLSCLVGSARSGLGLCGLYQIDNQAHVVDAVSSGLWPWLAFCAGYVHSGSRAWIRGSYSHI